MAGLARFSCLGLGSSRVCSSLPGAYTDWGKSEPQRQLEDGVWIPLVGLKVGRMSSREVLDGVGLP